MLSVGAVVVVKRLKCCGRPRLENTQLLSPAPAKFSLGSLAAWQPGGLSRAASDFLKLGYLLPADLKPDSEAIALSAELEHEVRNFKCQ